MRKFKPHIIILGALTTSALSGFAQEQADTATAVTLDGVEVITRGPSTRKLRGSVTNTDIISSGELLRAACCNLGESFTTNPSVDVSYSDAATGARQIKLLGLSGTYVQMLTENIPNFRGSALPYGLGYIAGPWLQSIQVSKGASSVKNGYESITGQINIEMKKPQADQQFAANAYTDINGKVEINADGNIRLSKRLSTSLLLHGENTFASHDHNSDGFIDMPKIRQVAAMNRWAWMGSNYVFQAGVKFLDEKRRSGQDANHTHSPAGSELYTIDIDTRRWEGFTKNAYIFDHENDGNIALILSGSHNEFHSSYGHKLYKTGQANVYASLMFERKWGENHALSSGLSFNYYNYHQHYRLVQDATAPAEALKEIEGVSGAYAQYTYNIGTRLLVMGGLRYDYSSVYGSMLTPRLHFRWNPGEWLTIHGSAGRGMRTPHVLAENNFLLASGRRIIINPNVQQEDAANYGIGAGSTLYVAGKPLTANVEYYYTHFSHQLIADLDSDPHAVTFKDIDGRSFSHTLQVELTYPAFKDFTVTAAYRLTNVKTDYGQGLVDRPLTSRNKGLITASYSPMMGIWQFDVTCSFNGSGRMPTPYNTPTGALSWSRRYHPYAQLNAQITRNFRHWSLYVGGENLTAYRQKRPIVGAENPWSTDFDATMVYAPLHGAIIYAGFRYTFTKY
ncbi:MAG: TonB-dependent receptor [Firmicutes bacterium]|nr:TonB-dependent receptor [Bacillota bacterium]MCM1401617.1 TonB-dependent receptor [Bacteroides sp.]MCM1477764.1 TonB-dependent receptor [Bacteroides sp.]